MSYSFPHGPNVTVANGATVSPAMVMDHTISDAESITVTSPAVLAETGIIQWSNDFDVDHAAKGVSLAAATAAATWEDGEALGAQGVSVVILAADFLPARAWRIELNGAAAAARTFIVTRRVLAFV